VSRSLGDILEPCAQLAQLGALRRDELPNQPGSKEHASDGEARLHQIDEGAETHATDHAPEDGDDPNNYADDEQARSHHAEEKQRLAREAELEPDRQHVEQADRYSSDSKLGLAGVAGIKGHPNFGYLESLGGGHHDHVAMPVGSVRERVHYFAPIRLY